MRKGNMRWIGVWVVLSATGLTSRANIEVLEKTGSAFAQIAKEALPAVVFVQVETTIEVPQYSYRHRPFGEIFGQGRRGGGVPEEEQPQTYRQEGQGSGFIISKDGYILTNNHVVNKADRITVALGDGRTFEAALVGTDPKSEVALIKIQDDCELPFLSLGDSDALQVGAWVLAAGNPFGLSQTITAGIVSAKNRDDTGIAEYGSFIQTDAAINPGNSGGPLLNIRGEVVGINTAIYTRTGGYMGIGFAIPINQAKTIKDQLLEYGRVRRSLLGIGGSDVTEDMAPFFGLDEASGIIVNEVIPDTAAVEAGLQFEDIILELNGEPVSSYAAFRNRVASSPPGAELELEIIRDGERKTIRAITRAMEASLEGLGIEPVITPQKLGMTVENLDAEIAGHLGQEDTSGVFITEVEQGGPAWRAGLQPGLIIASVNRESVENVREFKAALADAGDAEAVLFRVKGGRNSRFIVVKID